MIRRLCAVARHSPRRIGDSDATRTIATLLEGRFGEKVSRLITTPANNTKVVRESSGLSDNLFFRRLMRKRTGRPVRVGG